MSGQAPRRRTSLRVATAKIAKAASSPSKKKKKKKKKQNAGKRAAAAGDLRPEVVEIHARVELQLLGAIDWPAQDADAHDYNGVPIPWARPKLKDKRAIHQRLAAEPEFFADWLGNSFYFTVTGSSFDLTQEPEVRPFTPDAAPIPAHKGVYQLRPRARPDSTDSEDVKKKRAEEEEEVQQMARRRNCLLLNVLDGVDDWASETDFNAQVLSFTFQDPKEDPAVPWLECAREGNRKEEMEDEIRRQAK
jgi:hypothetical protein